MYLLGKIFMAVSDHLPLVSVFNFPKSQIPFRVKSIKLQDFDFETKHGRGKSNLSGYI